MKLETFESIVQHACSFVIAAKTFRRENRLSEKEVRAIAEFHVKDVWGRSSEREAIGLDVVVRKWERGKLNPGEII